MISYDMDLTRAIALAFLAVGALNDVIVFLKDLKRVATAIKRRGSIIRVI